MTTIFLSYSPQSLEHYYGSRALAQLQALADVRLNHRETQMTPDDLVREAGDCQIIVSSRIPEVPASVFDRLPNLVAYCRCAVDIRNIDVAAASRNGVLVTQATAGFAVSVSELILGGMIDLSRHLSHANIAYRRGVMPEIRMGRELRGATLGVVGYGAIARYLCKIAHALGMRVVVADPYAQVDDSAYAQVTFDALLAQSDYVVCLATATAATENLFDRSAFSKMRRTAFFINASRGELVDDAALLEALDGDRIAGAALDVGRADDQMPSPALTGHPRVVATPHIGGLTPQAAEHQAMDTVAQVAALLAGRVPQGALNTQHASRLSRFTSRRIENA